MLKSIQSISSRWLFPIISLFLLFIMCHIKDQSQKLHAKSTSGLTCTDNKDEDSENKSLFKHRNKRWPAGTYLFRVNNGNTKTMCEICSKLTIKTPNDVSDVVLVSLMLSLNSFHAFFWCFYCSLWTSKCLLGGKYQFKVNNKVTTPTTTGTVILN